MQLSERSCCYAVEHYNPRFPFVSLCVALCVSIISRCVFVSCFPAGNSKCREVDVAIDTPRLISSFSITLSARRAALQLKTLSVQNSAFILSGDRRYAPEETELRAFFVLASNSHRSALSSYVAIEFANKQDEREAPVLFPYQFTANQNIEPPPWVYTFSTI